MFYKIVFLNFGLISSKKYFEEVHNFSESRQEVWNYTNIERSCQFFSMIWCKINLFIFQRNFFQLQLIESSFNVICCIHLSFIKEYCIEFSLSSFWNIVRLIEKHTTSIPRWNVMKTVVSTSFQRGTLVLYLHCYC